MINSPSTLNPGRNFSPSRRSALSEFMPQFAPILVNHFAASHHFDFEQGVNSAKRRRSEHKELNRGQLYQVMGRQGKSIFISGFIDPCLFHGEMELLIKGTSSVMVEDQQKNWLLQCGWRWLFCTSCTCTRLHIY